MPVNTGIQVRPDLIKKIFNRKKKLQRKNTDSGLFVETVVISTTPIFDRGRVRVELDCRLNYII